MISFSTCWSLIFLVINRMAYYACRLVDRKSNNNHHNNVVALKAAVVYAMANILNTHPIITSSLFWRPVEAVIVAGNGFSESCHWVCMWLTVQNIKLKKNALYLRYTPFLKQLLICSQTLTHPVYKNEVVKILALL